MDSKKDYQQNIDQDNASGKESTIDGSGSNDPGRQQAGDSEQRVDPLYQMLKPLHNLPRGKNTWDPKFIRKWWFWPVSALVIIILFYVYPHIWDYFAG